MDDVRRWHLQPSGRRGPRDAGLKSNGYITRLADEPAETVIVGLLASGFAHPGIMPADHRCASFARA